MIPLILLPGMMCDERLFTPQIDAFSGERDVSVFALSDHVTIADLAADILAKSPDHFALVGLSMGGIVAMEMMAQAAERIEKIALLDTNPLAEVDEVKQRRQPQLDAVKQGRLRDVMRDEMKPNYLSKGPRREAVLKTCMDMALDLGPEVFIRQSHALMDRVDQTKTLKNIDVPTLILCGRDDTLCPLSRHELMHQLVPHSTLDIIENAGHLPTLEQPETTNESLRKWLKH
jgi:pimeloyl-ACP methyl ester carboxylesterase